MSLFKTFAIILSGFFYPSMIQEATLRWEPKEGDRVAYKFSGTTSISEIEGSDIKLQGEITETTIRVDSEKVVTKTTGQLNATIPGRDAEVNVEFKPDVTTYARNGRTLSVLEEGSPEAFRLARRSELVLPQKPVHPGDTWTVDEPSDVKAGLPRLRIEFKFVGLEDIGSWSTYKVTSKTVEAGSEGAKFEASFWIDRLTGARIRIHTVSVDESESAKGGAARIETDLMRQKSLP